MSDNTENQGQYITLAEAAALLRVGVRQVHNHIAADRVHSIKRGTRRYLLAEDVRLLAQLARYWEAEGLPVPWDNVLELPPRERVTRK